ncbi:MAG: class I SAM-dependent methyltransferase [Pseudoclavibacter sp.]|nr:class I SAM-dependent methyltransferase [Pseudoclavibacter sp.]
MDRQELIALLTPEAMGLLARLPRLDGPGDALGLVTRLRREGHAPATVAAVLGQLRLRRRAAAKFGPFAERMLFTEAGLEQATRLQIAAHHAERFRAAGVRSIADLGCGIGADSMAFASLGFRVIAVDRDEVTAAVATHNLAVFDDVEVRHGAAEEQDLSEVEALWFDPARRADGKRLRDPGDWSPSLDFVFARGGPGRRHALGVKLAPAVPHELLPEGEGVETQWVSVDRELVESTVWAGGTERPGVTRSALVTGRRGSHELNAEGAAEDEPVGELGAYLHEPDPAVVRARLIGDLARELGARMIAPDIAWMTTDEAAASPFAASFRVREVLPLQPARLKRELRERGIGALEIKKRGVDVDPAELRRRLALRGEEQATLILTRIGAARRAILADREAEPEPDPISP